MHPRLTEDGAEVILRPDDLLEGKGNFLRVDAAGDPEGFKLVRLPRIVSRDVFVGSTPNATTKQNPLPVPVYEGGYLITGPLVEGEKQPDDLLIAPLSRPLAPMIKVRPADVVGYPESTPEHPYWLALTNYRDGKHTPLGPPVQLPPLAQGQSFVVGAPDSVTTGTTHLGWWLSVPGAGTPSATGEMRLQKLTPVATTVGLVSFTGPYTYATDAPSNTGLRAPSAPETKLGRDGFPCRIGLTPFRVTAANEIGESLPSATGSVSVAADPRYNDEEGNPQAGAGRIRVNIIGLPPEAKGYYLYALVENSWQRVYNKLTGEGNSKPFPVGQKQILTGLWSGSEELGKDDLMLIGGGGNLPVENTSALTPPDSPPEIPTISGSLRPGPGRYFARQRDRSEADDESPLSDPAWVDIGENEVMEVVFSNPVNQLPNATFVHQGADGYPLGYTVTGSGVDLDNGELIMNGSGNGIVVSDTVSINSREQWSVGSFLKVALPQAGAFTGSFEMVLRELSATGVQTDTVLDTFTALGEYEHHTAVSPVGSGGILEWDSDTISAQLVYRFSGTSKMQVRISRQLLNDYIYSFRRRDTSSANGPANTNPPPGTTADPTGAISIEPPPTPPTSPELEDQSPPDRPTSAGEILDTQTFGGSVPWTSDVTGSTLTTSSGKLVASKTGPGTARANIYQSFPPETGLADRHSLGVAANGITIPVLPSNGSITLLELRTPDGVRYGWVDVDTRREVAKLRIDKPPTSSGNISTTLDEGSPTTRTTAVVATREVSSIQVDEDPALDGQVSVSVGDTTRTIPVRIAATGVHETVQVEITRSAAAFGVASIELHNSLLSHPNSYVSAYIWPGDSPNEIANKLRAYPSTTPSWAGEEWTISGQGRYVVLTAKVARPTPGGHRFYPNQTHADANVSTLTSGVSEVIGDNASSIATKIRAESFPGFQVDGTGSSVDIEALEPGPKPATSYDSGATGANATVTTVTPGTQDSIDEVADNIVTTYAGNTFFSVTRSGTLLTISALSDGAKQDAAFSPGTTGVEGQIATTIQGSSDIVVYAKDQFGVTRQRRLFTGVNTSTIYNIGIAGSGGGYLLSGNPSKAAIQVWASTASAPKTLKGLFEDVDLGGYPAGMVATGVTGESSTSLTWEVRIDEVKVTDKGETYYRYHDYYGDLLNQLYFSHPPSLLLSEGLGVRELRMAVLPNTEYAMEALGRWNGFADFTESLYLYCVAPNGSLYPIGDLSGPGIKGTRDWDTVRRTFTVPSGYNELLLESKTISGGELVIQELAFSKGATVSRSPFYAESGSYISTLNIETPKMRPNALWTRERRHLAADIFTPDGTSTTVTYRARNTSSEVYGSPVSDPSTLEQKNQIRVDILAYSDGLDTPVVLPGSPNVEYVVLLEARPVGTLLRGDRTELRGGAFFVNIDRYAEPPEVIYQALPGRRFVRFAVYPPVGNQPAFELQCFTPEAKAFLENESGLEDLVIEAWGKILTIRLSGPVALSNQTPELELGGQIYGWYVGTLPEAQVIDIRNLP